MAAPGLFDDLDAKYGLSATAEPAQKAGDIFDDLDQKYLGAPADQGPAAPGPAPKYRGSAEIRDTGRVQSVVAAARSAGFFGKALETAVAVALAESGGNHAAIGDRNYSRQGEKSIGLWQINFRPGRDEKNPVRDPRANMDPSTNARNAYAISGGGKNFRPWTTYRNGAYKKYLEAAKAAIQRSGGAGAGALAGAMPVLSPSGAAIGASAGVVAQPKYDPNYPGVNTDIWSKTGPTLNEDISQALSDLSRSVSDTGAKVGEGLMAPAIAVVKSVAPSQEKAARGISRGIGRLGAGLVDVPGMLALANDPNPKKIAEGFYDTVSKSWAADSTPEDRVVGLGTAVLTLLGLKHGVSSFRNFAKNRNAAALEAGLKKAGATDAQAQGATMAAERAAGPNIEPEAKTTAANPKSSPEPPPVGEPPTTGLANQVQEREAEAGILKDIPATAGKSPEHWQQVGKKEFGEDYDFEALASRVANGDEELTGAKVGILLEGKRRLMAERNRLSQRVKDNPGDKAAKEALAAHDERIDAFVRDVQVGKGAWSDVGRALQAGATLDEGNFAQVLERAKETGRTPSAAWHAETEKLSAEVSRLTQEIEGLKSGAQSVRQVKTRLSKDNILKEIDDIGAEWEKLKTAGTGSRNPKVTKTTGAILVTKADLAKLGKRGELIARYIKAHAKLGAASVEEFVKTVKVNLLEKLGVDVGDQLVIDVAAETGTRPSPTELQRQGASLRAKLKRASTKGETKRIADLERQIQENKAALENPELQAKPPLPRVVSERVKQLEAEAKIYASRVRGKLRAHEEGVGKRLAQGAAQTVRGTQLGSDVGILTRQGLFSLSRPLDFAKGIGSGLKAAISETKLAAMEKALDERVVNGRKAIVAEKESGIQRTSHFGGFNQQEELTLARLFQAVPEFVAKGLDKIGAKPVGAVVRKVGQMGGSLERFQHAFINKVRAEAFDRALKLGYSADELKARARFINNATGRGNFKNVPTALQFVMTSPRYEASRWAMMAEPFRNPGRILADLAKGRGLNRGAVANLQDMAITAAEVYGLYKLAEGAGYSTDFDPTSSDFLKLRKGKEVWDPTAGMAPRIRDTIRVAVAFKNPQYAKERDFDLQSAVGKAATRTISPAVRTPIEQSYQAVQRNQGIDEAKLRSFFTGRTIDPEDAKGWLALAPLIVQTFWQTLQEEDPKAAWEAGLKEFVGQSINRYPEVPAGTVIEDRALRNTLKGVGFVSQIRQGEDESPEDFAERLKDLREAVTPRLKALVASPEWKRMNRSQRKEAAKAIFAEER